MCNQAKEDRIDWWLWLDTPTRSILLDKYYPEFEGPYGDLKISQIIHMYNSEKAYEEQMVNVLETGKIKQEFISDGLEYYCNICHKAENNCFCSETENID